MKIKEGGVMDIQDNSVVTDVDTEILDGEITQISNDFSETYYFDGEQEEELEMLVAKAMKLGELYERKKWQAAKAQAVPAQLDVNSILHDIDCYFDNGLSNTERAANNLLQSIYEKLSGEVKAQEPDQ